MSEVLGRGHEVATDGSDMAELLCRGLLEPLTDSLVGTCFRGTNLEVTNREQQVYFDDGQIVTIEFTARRSPEGISDTATEDSIFYDICITRTRSASEGEFWPQFEQTDDDEEGGSVLFASEDSNENDDAEEEFDIRTIQEAWHFLIDDEQYRPRKDIRFEYYVDGEMIHLESFNENNGSSMLVEDVDQDVDLNVKDGCFARTFSEHDIEIIEAACDFNFQKVISLLRFYEYPDDL